MLGPMYTLGPGARLYIYNLILAQPPTSCVAVLTVWCTYLWDFPGGSVVKNLPAKAGAADLIPGWERSPEGGNGNPFQYSCLENPMDRGTWQAIVHGVEKSQTRLSTSTGVGVGDTKLFQCTSWVRQNNSRWTLELDAWFKS